MVDETGLVERLSVLLTFDFGDESDHCIALAETAGEARTALEALQQDLDAVLHVVDELYRKYETELDAEDVAIVQAARTALQNGASNGR